MPMLLTDRMWTSKKSREEGEPMISGSQCVISGYTVTTLVDVLDAKTFNKEFSDPGRITVQNVVTDSIKPSVMPMTKGTNICSNQEVLPSVPMFMPRPKPSSN